MNLSVIVPAYNEEELLPRAIESILNQSELPAEVIIVNDGSTDNTGQIAESYGGIVKHVFQENRGLAAARNAGIKIAKSMYVGFLDADDEWNKDFLKTASNVLNRTDLAWYTCSYERRHESGETIFIKKIPENLHVENIISDYFEVEAKHHFSITNTMIIRADVLKEVGLFDEDIGKYGEDLDMWFRVALKYPKIAYSEYIGSVYWTRQGSITTRENLDIDLFVKRIHKTESSAFKLGINALVMSNVLVLDWVWKAVKECVKQGDKKILQHLFKFYFFRFNITKKFLLIIFLSLPSWFMKSILFFMRSI